MRRLPTWLLCLLVLTQQGTHAAPTLKEDPLKTDMAKLEGTWRVESYIVSGVALSEEQLRTYPTVTLKATDKGLEYVWERNAALGKISRIDPKSKPKEIDFLVIGPDGTEQKQFGIYEIDGDTYRDCIARTGKPRPTSFESTGDNGYFLMIKKRVKAEK